MTAAGLSGNVLGVGNDLRVRLVSFGRCDANLRTESGRQSAAESGPRYFRRQRRPGKFSSDRRTSPSSVK